MGVVLYALISGRLPFNGKSFKEITESIKKDRPKVPKELDVSYELKDLIERLLIKTAKNRIYMKEILRHPWILGTKIPA
jgi:serine/threonine protein kinase